MAIKECFGQLANAKITYNNSTRRHYFRVDDEKLKECDRCNLFTKCMFLRYNEIIKELVEIVDDVNTEDSRKRLG
jgi:hypothetical protein